MEILSDATFKGSLTIQNVKDGGINIETTSTTLKFTYVDSYTLAGDTITRCTQGCVLALINGPYSGSNMEFDSGLLTGEMIAKRGIVSNGTVESCTLRVNDLQILYHSFIGDGYVLELPGKSGTIATTSDIPSLSGYLTTSTSSSTYLSKTDASTTYQKKFTTFSSPSIPANCTAFEFTGTAISDSNKTHLIQVQNTSTGKSVIAETWMTTNKKPAMSFAGCTSTIAAGTYTAIVL